MNNEFVEIQKKKIKKAVKIINRVIPKNYPKVSICIFHYIDSMLRSTAREYDISYKEICKYVKTLNKKMVKNNYINTKYYQPEYIKKNHKVDARTLLALSGHPVYLNIENTYKFTTKNYIFLLLHELGHNYYKDKKSLKWTDEKEVDRFAIRWYKRIVGQYAVRLYE